MEGAIAQRIKGKWLDIAMIRMNHAGVKVKTPLTRDSEGLADVHQVVAQTEQVHAQGGPAWTR
jgi:hypothetical protein